MIYRSAPSSWQELEERVCQIFLEIGCEAVRNRSLVTARGSVNIDVFVRDVTQQPHLVILCECKHWRRKVPKEKIHAFRTVVQDAGAAIGLIITQRGFQSGSVDAAANSNVKLLTWDAFQEDYEGRWLISQANRLRCVSDAICELAYTDDEHGRTRTLVDEAIGESDEVLEEFDGLKTRYVQYGLSSTAFGAYLIPPFPIRGIDPRTPRKTVVFDCPRTYYDIMLGAAHIAYGDYAQFLLKYTGGYFGNRSVLDDGMVGQIQEGCTTMADATRLLGNYHSIQTGPKGELWRFRGQIARFELPVVVNEDVVGHAITSGRIVEIQFGRNKIAMDVSIEDFESMGMPH